MQHLQQRHHVVNHSSTDEAARVNRAFVLLHVVFVSTKELVGGGDL